VCQLELRGIAKTYPDGWRLQPTSLRVSRGERVSLLGPSGCGKTTLLRLIAGLEVPDLGQVLAEGVDVTNSAPHARGFGLMFQDFALFPHMNVFDNVSFGLRMQSLRESEIAAQAAGALALVGLSGFEERDVNQLSGGEQQRVALARSLAPRPRLLMLDEPLGALDRTLRERLMDEIPEILLGAGVTTITVTHDLQEAFAFSDRVVLMRAGQVVQVGSPAEVYDHPCSEWAARFLGLTNLLGGRVVGPGRVDTAIGVLTVSDSLGAAKAVGADVTVLISPAAARLGKSSINQFRAVVRQRSFRGDCYRLVVSAEGADAMRFDMPSSLRVPVPNEPILLSLDPEALVLLPRGERLGA
jgi:ABC-type Fe3+/spermidine/putrescine transport system ATPase subunit